MAETSMSAVSVDVIPLAVDESQGRVHTAAYQRRVPPYEGNLALPGVLLTAGERLNEAATRALAKVGISDNDVAGVGQIVVFDEPSRDPRGPTLSVVCWAALRPGCEVDSDAVFDVHNAPSLAFDHNRILDVSIPLIGERLWRDLHLTQALTGHAFPIARALTVTRALTGRDPNRGNLNRTLRGIESLTRTDERVTPHGTGRPGAVWAWSAVDDSVVTGM